MLDRVRALQATKVETMRKDGRVHVQPIPGSEFEIQADLVLLAMGFLGPERGALVNDLGLKMTERGNVWRDERWMTSVPGVFAAGDMQRGQSLIVWAIAEGRSAARGVDQYLMGESDAPGAVAVTHRSHFSVLTSPFVFRFMLRSNVHERTCPPPPRLRRGLAEALRAKA